MNKFVKYCEDKFCYYVDQFPETQEEINNLPLWDKIKLFGNFFKSFPFALVVVAWYHWRGKYE